MEIKIDYYVRNRETGRVVEIKHSVINDDDILEAATKKYKEDYTDFDYYTVEPRIEKISIDA